jgi:hypothetical protein
LTGRRTLLKLFAGASLQRPFSALARKAEKAEKQLGVLKEAMPRLLAADQLIQ